MNEETFDYFNIDTNLLVLHILLEGFYRGQTTFTLEQFIKGDYWKIEEIKSEIIDTNDYGSVEGMVLHQVVKIIEDFNLGKVKKVSITDLYGLTEKVIREAVGLKDATEDNIMYYTSIIREISDLDKIRDKQREELFHSGKKIDYSRLSANRVEFSKDDFYRHTDSISAISAPFIEVEVSFNDKKATELHKDIEDFLFNFYQDVYVEQKPFYKQKRHYFSKQLENFFEYIKRFPLVDGYVNIPFSAILEQGFEAVKILSFLENNKRIKVRNWNDTELWNVKFHKVPITLASLLGQEDDKDSGKPDESGKIKLNLSFSLKTGTMVLADENGKEHKVKVQGQVQREVLRVIFQFPKNIYSEWSLYDISDTLGNQDVDETAVKNAIYQFNRKVKLTIPEVENLFELTKHTARLNPKYVKIA